MRLIKLVEGLQDINFEGNVSNFDVEILNISIDSRKEAKNTLFICIDGGSVDSHTLIEEAKENGAVAIVAERKVQTSLPLILVKDTRQALGLLASKFYGEPSKKMKIIGITGTNGKTTTSYMLASILKTAGKKVGIIGTLGIDYADKHFPSSLTTPDPITLHAHFADMGNRGIEYVVMEVSAHALYYKKLAGITFAACIFTNLTQDHLDFFKTMEEYKAAKLALFSPQKCEIAIVNGDDDTGREINKLREEMGARTYLYGLTSPADGFALVTDDFLGGIEAVFNLNDNLYRVRLRMIGEHNVYNALAAASCAQLLGFERSISRGLANLKDVCGRLQRINRVNGAEIYVDFAHTPDGLEKSLKTLKKYCVGRLICLFGCGGNRDKSKRGIMGERAAKYCDFALLTSDNPRYEDPLDIINAIEKGYRKISNKYVIIPDREKAIEYALECLGTGDILLIAGKGGECYQEIMGIKYPFNDQDMVVKLLEQKGKK